MGDLDRVRTTCLGLGITRDREMRLTLWLEECRHDIRFAVRQLVGAPTFAVVATITLALGIGANSAIFALVDAILLRPLPFKDPERLAVVWQRTERTPRGRASVVDIADWYERGHSFEQVAGFVPGTGGAMVMAGANGASETVPRQWVTASFFDVLGVAPVAGRTFHAADASPRPLLAVMSEGVWRTRFARDPSVVGRQIRFDGLPFTVVGIVPERFQFLGTRGIWAMLPDSRAPAGRRQRNLMTVVRLKTGVTLEAARSDMSSVADAVAVEFPDTNRGRGVTIEPARSVVIGEELRVTSLLFLSVVGLVLLMCCANVANLLLARATGRTRELAVRSALGAGRRRIIRQLLIESLVLSVGGGVLGLAIGGAILKAAPALIPVDLLPGEVTLSFDLRVVAFAAAAAVLAGFVFGLAPAWQATGLSTARSLAGGSRGSTGPNLTVRRFLVVGQVAVAVVLLFGGGLLLRTLIALDHIDRGYGAESVLTMMVDPLGSSYPTREALAQFFDSVERQIRTLPGVQSVAWSSSLPMSGSNVGTYSFQAAGDSTPSDADRPIAQPNVVSPSYFQTIDLKLLAGRSFSNLDTADSVPVCIVDEAFVRRLGGRAPIGLHVELRPTSAPAATPQVREIVGVARQVRRPDGTADAISLYVPQAQFPLDDLYVLVRPGSGSGARLTGGVRAAIARVDREQLVSVRDIATLDDVAWEHTARHRFRAQIVSVFAGLALVLAMVGVFGVLIYTVQQRRREFGVRMALGATSPNVVALVLQHASGVIAVGVLLGIGLAALLGRLLNGMLFGVQPLDAMTFAAVVIVIAIMAGLAAAAPAWRASLIDPAIALRAD
jgi:predicted permease